MSPNTVSLRDIFEEEIVKLFMAPRTIFGRLEDGDTIRCHPIVLLVVPKRSKSSLDFWGFDCKLQNMRVKMTVHQKRKILNNQLWFLEWEHLSDIEKCEYELTSHKWKI